MDENDKRIKESGRQFNLLIDSSVYHEMQKIADNLGTHPLDLLENYPNIQIFFSQAMINENARGKMGFGDEAMWMMQRALQDEGSFVGREARFLYNHEDGTTRVITLNNISGEDYGQILLAQNHKELVLLTNDHRMLKSAAALLSNRIMDLPNLLAMMKETIDPLLKAKWTEIAEWYQKASGYTPPLNVHYIEGIVRDPHPLTGEVHTPQPQYLKKKKTS